MDRSKIPGLLIVVLATSLAWPALAADETPPVIKNKSEKASPRGEPVVIRATIADPAGVFDPSLLYRLNGEGEFQRMAMVAVPGEENLFVATIPSVVVTDAVSKVEYFIEAYDNEGNGPTLEGAEASPLKIAIAQRAPDEGDPNEPVNGDPTSNGGVTPTNPPASTADESEGGGFGLWLGIGAGVVGVVVVVAVAAAAGTAAVIYFTRPDTLDEVTINVSGPSPVAVP